MPVGLETYGTNGAVQVAYTGRIARQLGSVNTGTSNGSISVPGLALGVPWVAALLQGNILQNAAPMIAVSGTTISWTFLEGSPGGKVPAIIRYGVR